MPEIEWYYKDKLPKTIDGKEAICEHCGIWSGHHSGQEPYKNSTSRPETPCPGFKLKQEIKPCPHGSHHKNPFVGPHIIERLGKFLPGERFGACVEHLSCYQDPTSYKEIEQETPVNTYAFEQKMQARFPGTCFLCKGRIEPTTQYIVPVTSERTAKGRHPWAHETCAAADKNGRGIGGVIPPVQQEEDTPLVAKDYKYFHPIPVSTRQKSLLGQNVETVLRTLATHPTGHFVLVGFESAEAAQEFAANQDSFTQVLKGDSEATPIPPAPVQETVAVQ